MAYKVKFHPERVEKFCFEGYEYDEANHLARLSYAFAMDSGSEITFTETFEFTDAGPLTSDGQRNALDRALRFLHIAAGVSYYKAAAPGIIEIKGAPLLAEEAAFFEKLYRNGLAEFAYVNRLDLWERIRFPFATTDCCQGEPSTPIERREIIDYPWHRGIVVPLGGGKDSLVTMEIMKRAAIPIRLFHVGGNNTNGIIERIIEASNPEAIRIKRTLSRNLLDLNKNGAYNGHVPISAIIAFVSLAAGILYGFDTVLISNERSANVGSFVGNGVIGGGNGTGRRINHQYSKSFEFERDFRALVRQNVIEGFHYYSFLRPLSELMIGRIFSEFRDYHDLFVSCNRAFSLHGKHKKEWCCDCPKCRFVFLSLAPFFEKKRLVGIFGKNMLDDPGQRKGFLELMGIGGSKPFDCVGEETESVAAMMLLRDKPEWKDDGIVKGFSDGVYSIPGGYTDFPSEVFEWSDEHHIPPEFEGLLRKAEGNCRGRRRDS
uniref:UDP-N-acetyl-alpha-D-muramoyl-L-alanyl-L-glutamate epimerase n=1 Tax=Candidatus Kentrum sp. DK TaxID=2126562 RepID=A0A450S575_9GAMM|nr:MAG: hypothetical protein BECKDK2373B_GA0170837_101534 [Candidatus Kentron sp. DK]